MKKLIYILILIFSVSAFSQEKPKIETSKNIISNIIVSPNPFTEKTNIIFYGTSKGNINFIVQDLLGNIIYSEQIVTSLGKNNIPFYRNKLRAGIYIYTLKTKNEMISKRFVIR